MSNEEAGPTGMFRVQHSGGIHRVDGCSSIRHVCCCRSGQCARNQQVGSSVGRRGWTVEELDSESQTALLEAGNRVSPDRVPMPVLDALEEDLERVDRQVPRSPPSSQFALPVQNRFAVLDATDGRVATVAELVRRLRLVSQGAQVSQVSGRVGVVDEDASVPGSDSVGTHPHEELSVVSVVYPVSDFAQSPAALHLFDGQFASRLTLCWCVFSNLDGLNAERLAMGRLLSFLGRSFAMARGLGCPLPLSSVWRLNCQRRGPTMHLPCVPTSLLSLQLAFTHSRFLTVCVVG